MLMPVSLFWFAWSVFHRVRHPKSLLTPLSQDEHQQRALDRTRSRWLPLRVLNYYYREHLFLLRFSRTNPPVCSFSLSLPSMLPFTALW